MLCSFVTSSNHVVRFLETKEPKIQDCGNSAKILNKLLKNLNSLPPLFQPQLQTVDFS